MTRILHGPENIAMQASLQVEWLRAAGYDADLAIQAHAFAYRAAPRYTWPHLPANARRMGRFHAALRTLGAYDIYHYHFGASYLPPALGFIDARINRRLGATVVVQFWGSDSRLHKVEALRNPAMLEAQPNRDDELIRRMRQWATITSGVAIVADHSFDAPVGPWFPHLLRVPQGIDWTAVRPALPAPADGRRPRVVHIPSHRAVKGTEHVRRAVATLEAQGLSIEYVEVSRVRHAEAIALMQSADIVVDQLLCGSHGIFSIESMAACKPVICNLLPELAATYPPDLPLINADPTTIASVLESLLRAGPDHWRTLGMRGRAYAEREHSETRVTERLEAAYRRAGELQRAARGLSAAARG